jgi:hypothetical protein
MKSLSFLPLIFSFAAALPTQRQTETACTTRWSAINGLIVELEGRVREGEDSFLGFPVFFGSKSKSTLCFLVVP